MATRWTSPRPRWIALGILIVGSLPAAGHTAPPRRGRARSLQTLPPGAMVPQMRRRATHEPIDEGLAGLMAEDPPPLLELELDFEAEPQLWEGIGDDLSEPMVPGFNPDLIRPAGGNAEGSIGLAMHGRIPLHTSRPHDKYIDWRPALVPVVYRETLPDEVREAVATQIESLSHSMWQCGRRRGVSLPRRVSMRDYTLVVGRGGRVLDVDLDLHVDGDDPGVRRCLRRRLKRWPLPAPPPSVASYEVLVSWKTEDQWW